jgi:Protein of unknown function (DUF2934)
MKMEKPAQETAKEPTKKQVTCRAYQLWEQAGKPEGRDQEFYHQAERELAVQAPEITADEQQKTFLE